MDIRNQARKEQTHRELARLKGDIQTWLSLRSERDKDESGQKIIHKTRLEALASVLNDTLTELKHGINDIDAGEKCGTGQVYEACRQYDLALVWLHRLWTFYRTRFDQRDDANLRPLLDAADELVWSCYKQVYNQGLLPPGVEIGPAPLPFVESEYSPAAWAEDQPLPPELGVMASVPELQDAIQNLPIPLLRLPPWCVHSPWWLVFVAHEVGHHVVRELRLKDAFAEGLAQVASSKNQASQAGAWKGWGEEIFADLFSVMMVGPWALRALIEIELAPDLKLLVRRSQYPAPLVRFKLMACAASRLEMAGTVAALAGLDLEKLAQSNPPVKQDLALVKPLLDYALGPWAKSFGALEKLCNLPPLRAWLGDEKNGLEPWARTLATQSQPGAPPPSLVTPRLVACSAVAGWEMAVRQESQKERQRALKCLKENTVSVLQKSGPPGVRGEQLKPVQVSGKGADLAQALLKLSRKQMEQEPTSHDI